MTALKVLYPNFAKQLTFTIDLFHIDGEHSTKAVDIEVKTSLTIDKPGSVYVIDDTESKIIMAGFNPYKKYFDMMFDASCWAPNTIYKRNNT